MWFEQIIMIVQMVGFIKVINSIKITQPLSLITWGRAHYIGAAQRALYWLFMLLKNG